MIDILIRYHEERQQFFKWLLTNFSGTQAEATVTDMRAAIQQRSGHQAAEKFANLVAQLRQCNEATFRKLADMMLARQDQPEG